MQPMPLVVAVMDSARAGKSVTHPVHVLSAGERVWRGLKRTLLVSAIGLGILPLPLMHVCGAVVAVIAGPIAGIFAARAHVLLGGGSVACAKCDQPLAVKDGTPGWPARVHCVSCGAMIELRPERAA